DAAGVVDEVGVQPAAVQCVLDASALRTAEIATFTGDLAAQVLAVDAHAVVGAIADLGIALVAGLHVSADAAVPQQVDLHAQHGANQLLRRERVALQSQHGLRLRGNLQRLGAARINAAALG